MKTFLKVSLIAIIAMWSLCAACQRGTNQKVQNIETFARLYGYARWFHPSDEAQEVDWDKFAVLGVQKVENVKSSKALRDTLFRLFSPIVQGLQIYETGKPGKFNPDILSSPDPDAKTVAWQHYGVYLNEGSIYKSVRTNKSKIDINQDGAIIYKVFTKPSHLQGKEVRFSGYFKNKSQNKEGAKLFLQYILQDDNKIHEALIESHDWGKHELTVTIPENSVAVAYGLWIVDNAEVSADDLEFLVNNGSKWESADTVNMGFESGTIDESRADDWKTINMKHCTFEVTNEDTHSGKYSLKLTFNFSGKMFDRIPQFGEVISEPIGSNLTCVVPLALLTNDSMTYPKTEISSLIRLKSEINNINYGRGFNPQVNLASVVITWNVLQHFFPYFDVIDTNWEKVLGETLKNTLPNTQKIDFLETLKKMVAKLDDGHGSVSGGERMYRLPIRAECIENKIVITASNNDVLKRGDIIKKIDGKPVMEVLAKTEKTISGSPHLRRHRALNILGSKYGLNNSSRFVIERDAMEQIVTVPNVSVSRNSIDDRQYRYEKIVEIDPGIYYINAINCTEEDIKQKIDVLANAKAVIYDQRYSGYTPQIFSVLIPHMTEKPLNSAWWNIPQTIYPNRKEVEFDKSNWSIQPQQPLFRSKIIIINLPSVISAGETIMGIIDNYNLATTVGEPTAGCNGNVNQINLPCGYSVRWTGMKVLKHDGSQLYLKGFEPDYPVNKTIQAIKEGRDEYLEKALEIARGK
ncbi:MAG: hypothetical protein LBQ60_16825 [Bacteroidales bacterium]|jgi:hypothetical protein|nr:hypothetical protein [Bacteroidales bacterium]